MLFFCKYVTRKWRGNRPRPMAHDRKIRKNNLDVHEVHLLTTHSLHKKNLYRYSCLQYQSLYTVQYGTCLTIQLYSILSQELFVKVTVSSWLCFPSSLISTLTSTVLYTPTNTEKNSSKRLPWFEPGNHHPRIHLRPRSCRRFRCMAAAAAIFILATTMD